MEDSSKPMSRLGVRNCKGLYLSQSKYECVSNNCTTLPVSAYYIKNEIKSRLLREEMWLPALSLIYPLYGP